MNKITALQFYKAWIEAVTSRKAHLLNIWRNFTEFTNSIKGSDNSVISEIANKLGLLSYEQDYYSLDTILYKQEDRVPNLNPNHFWFRNIRIAFEHENNFKSGLYQEVSHLLITNCDLRVLVSYPDDDTPNDELNYLHEIISGNSQSDVISTDESFLIIFGYENGFEWEGFVYKNDKWKPIS